MVNLLNQQQQVFHMSESDGIVHRKTIYNDSSLIATNHGIVNDSIKMGVKGGSLEN